MKLVLLGPPGAGKGTQATGIAEKYAIPHISTGDIFRYNIKNETELGREVKSYLDQGALVPDTLTVRIVKDRLNQADCANGFYWTVFPAPSHRRRRWMKACPNRTKRSMR